MNIDRRFSNLLPFILCIIFFGFLNSCKENAKPSSDHVFTNDLIHETSPYLLQHAHNPVNWQAWQPEVLEQAKSSNKLILLSIGYSSCHWCHVMEKETFEDEEVAKLMNENFINIKVDREERPDLDQVYQVAAQLQGKGGWPLNVIALPNGKPLYTGTYLPKKQWQEVLSNVNAMYIKDPIKAGEYADMLADGIADTNVMELSSDFEKLTNEVLVSGVEKWKTNWDLDLGGNQGPEKFITPNSLDFLLDYAVLQKDKTALNHVKNTLDKVANGGIYDHIGGGFYRYSTDPQWKVPHFEKMLYDNAQLIGLYSKAYKVFKEPAYKDLVFETVAFLDREMKHKDGGYFATLDADSDGEEGKFYIWKEEEIQSILGNDANLFKAYFNITPTNSWENDAYVLYKNVADDEFSKTHKISSNDLNALKNEWDTKLLKVRAERVRPNTDDKIITSWNALLISGFVQAHAAFGDKAFLDKAISIFNFIQSKSYKNGKLIHTYKKDSKRTEGFLEDYAFLIDASLKLYSVTLDAKYLEFSEELTTTVQTKFYDESTGMYRFNMDDPLISKIIKTNDGDIPSPNSVMAHNLFQLGHINYDRKQLNASKTMLTTLLPQVQEYAYSYANWNMLLLHTTQPYYEIAVVGSNAKKMTQELQSKHLPNTLVVGSEKESDGALFENRYFEDNTYIFVCQDSSCKLPVETVAEALKQYENF